MSQQPVVGTDPKTKTGTATDNKERASNDRFTDQLVLGLAAHPLSSCNPPPRELPDLLDSLIASEGRLKAQVVLIDRVGEGFGLRTQNLRERFHKLRAANPQFTKDVATQNTEETIVVSEERQIFQAQARVLQKMFLQVAFIHDTFSHKIKPLTMSAAKAHQDILYEFLGQRHAHPGIQVADSSKLLCTSDCAWYQYHGPYEWSKKPYTNVWWEEMNNTDWDWLLIRDHMSSTVATGGGRITAMYDMLQANSQKFIPAWFWSEDFETWTINATMESVKNADGQMERQVVVKVRFNKSVAMIQQETIERMKEMNKAQTEQGKAKADSTVQSKDSTTIEADKIGEMVIDQDLVFDAMASMAGADSRETRWLVWWGFEKWHAEAIRSSAGRGGTL